jgi:hypothetical protein
LTANLDVQIAEVRENRCPRAREDVIIEIAGGVICRNEGLSVLVFVGRFIAIVLLFLGNGRTGDCVFAVDPSAQIDETAAIAAEGEGWEGVKRGDFVALGTGWTASPDHGSLFDGVGAALAGSLLDALDDSVDVLASAAGFAGSLDDLSASAAFLYESLR